MYQTKYRYIVENYIYTIIIITTLLFWAGYSYLSSRNFLLILNGIYVGQMVAILIVFGFFFLYIMFTHDPYTRARQYAFTTGLQHLAYILVVWYSISNRKLGGNPTLQVDFSLLLSRYVVLIAGFMQLTAPDLGKPMLHGFNRKATWFGSFAGLIVAAGVIYLQFWPGVVADLRLDELLGLGD